MARNIRGRLNRVEKKTIKKGVKWFALINEDEVTIIFNSTGKSLKMNRKEFDEWEQGRAGGQITEVEWI